MSIPTVAIGRAWRREIRNFVIWQLLWLVAGFMAGHPLGLSCVGLVTYLALHMFQAFRLHRWLVGDAARDAPNGVGVWQEIFLEFYRLRQHNRKRKKQLRSIVKEFQASTAALPDGAIVLDSQGRIVWFNDAAAALLALRSPQDRGQRIVNLVRHPRFTAYLASNAPDKEEIEVPSGVGDDTTVAMRVIPYGSGQQLLIARDVSVQKRLEATRRDFVANASHELRTPLTVLRGYLDMMAEESSESGSLAGWVSPVSEMDKQAARMGRIIENLLKLARVESQGYQQPQESVDVPALVEHLVTNNEAVATGGQILERQLDPDLWLYGRPGELESIFSNLIANARQYSPRSERIAIRWWHDAEGAYFSVTDAGPGIEARHIQRLTERFYRVDSGRDRQAGGTGLGLAIVKHCLEHHQADLEITSQPGVGSRFTCRFPRRRFEIHDPA